VLEFQKCEKPRGQLMPDVRNARRMLDEGI
jgi:hypothetical protein